MLCIKPSLLINSCSCYKANPTSTSSSVKSTLAYSKSYKIAQNPYSYNKPITTLLVQTNKCLNAVKAEALECYQKTTISVTDFATTLAVS